MRTFLSILLILVCFANSFAQLNNEFAPDKTKWYQLYGGLLSYGPGFGERLYQHRIYWINGDTIINNKKFQKVYVSLGSYRCTYGRYGDSCYDKYPTMGNGFQPQYYNENNYKFLTYFYSDAGVTYTGQPESLTELYNFNLNLNDNFKTLKVIKVDTVIIDNMERKRITFDNETVWVDGIGNIESGLNFESRPNASHSYEILENFSINNRVIITNVGVGEDNKSQIYPNPANDIIWVNNPSFINPQMIVIIDIYGNEVLKENISENPAMINIANQKPGIYLIYLQDHKKRHLFKLVKN